MFAQAWGESSCRLHLKVSDKGLSYPSCSLKPIVRGTWLPAIIYQALTLESDVCTPLFCLILSFQREKNTAETTGSWDFNKTKHFILLGVSSNTYLLNYFNIQQVSHKTSSSFIKADRSRYICCPLVHTNWRLLSAFLSFSSWQVNDKLIKRTGLFLYQIQLYNKAPIRSSPNFSSYNLSSDLNNSALNQYTVH